MGLLMFLPKSKHRVLLVSRNYYEKKDLGIFVFLPKIYYLCKKLSASGCKRKCKERRERGFCRPPYTCRAIARHSSAARPTIVRRAPFNDFAVSNHETRSEQSLSLLRYVTHLSPDTTDTINRGLSRLYSNQQAEGVSDLSKAGELGLYSAYSIIKKYRK